MPRQTLTRLALSAILGFAVLASEATAFAAPVQGMVAAANPLAAEAGLKVLQRGGDAVDAAVAIQATLGLVEPQSSGIGGGAFLLVYDAKTGKVTAYNGREAAPAAATSTFFLQSDGAPIPFFDAILSGRSTGPPGAIAMLGLAHSQHGKLPWKDLFDTPRRMAADGFVVSPRLAGFVAANFPQAHAHDILAYFTKPDGTEVKAGDLLKNPAYARTLATLAAEGPRALYEGPIAADIAGRVDKDPGGVLSVADLKAYHAIASPGLCRPYRVYVVCVPPRTMTPCRPEFSPRPSVMGIP